MTDISKECVKSFQPISTCIPDINSKEYMINPDFLPFFNHKQNNSDYTVVYDIGVTIDEKNVLTFDPQSKKFVNTFKNTSTIPTEIKQELVDFKEKLESIFVNQILDKNFLETYMSFNKVEQIALLDKVSIMYLIYSIYQNEITLSENISNLIQNNITHFEMKDKHNQAIGDVLHYIFTVYFGVENKEFCNRLNTIQVDNDMLSIIVYNLLFYYGKEFDMSKLHTIESEMTKQEFELKKIENEKKELKQKELEQKKLEEQKELENKIQYEKRQKKILSYILSNINVDTLSIEQIEHYINVLI
jgi:hypothetical protein